MERPVGMRRQPCPHTFRLVRAMVVEDDMHLPVQRKLLLDGVEKGDEFLLPVAAHALSDHRAVEDIEGCKQGGRAMTLVVMGACLRPSFLHGKRRLRASQRLNLRFLVHRQDHRMLGRVDVEPHDVAQLVHERRVRRQLEEPQAVRRQAVLLPDEAHGRESKADPCCHGSQRPMGRLAVWRGHGQRHDLAHLGVGNRRPARRARGVVEQAVYTFEHVAPLPAPHAVF